MCNTTLPSVYDEDTEIDSEFESQDPDDLNNDQQVRDIYKKKDLPYRKQYCPFDECSAYFFVHWHLERHIRKHKGEVSGGPFAISKMQIRISVCESQRSNVQSN